MSCQAGFSIEDHQSVSNEILRNDVMFDDETEGMLLFDCASDGFRSCQAFFNIQVCAWFVQQVDLRVLRSAGYDRYSLQLFAA